MSTTSLRTSLGTITISECVQFFNSWWWVISRPKHVENTYKWNIYLSYCIKLVFSIIMYYAVCKIVLLYCFTLVLHFKFVPHTIIHSLLQFYCMHVWYISSICVCLAIVYIILFNNFDAEQSEKSLRKKLCLITYNIQYRIIVYILMTKSVSNAIVEMDQPIISNSINQSNDHILMSFYYYLELK
jgi:cellulose synthase/poly-beta-1,6-N-acetylglucosamine synthase-like glycosyltransferase